MACDCCDKTRERYFQFGEQIGCSICFPNRHDLWDFGDLFMEWEKNGFPWNGHAFTCPACGTDDARSLWLDGDWNIVGCDHCIIEVTGFPSRMLVCDEEEDDGSWDRADWLISDRYNEEGRR